MRRGHLGDPFHHAPHGGRLAYTKHVRPLPRQKRFAAKSTIFLSHLAQGDLRAHRVQHARVVPWLLDEVRRPHLHRLDRHVHAPPGRHHEQGKIGTLLTHARDKRKPLVTGRGVGAVVEVEDSTGKRRRRNRRESCRRRSHENGRDVLCTEQHLQGQADVGMVIDHEHGLAIVWIVHCDTPISA
ncbi:hypothetical protein KCV01_g16371, partial [Aureobasidium melanogenum]